MNDIKNLMFDLGGVIMDIRRENAVTALENLGITNADQLLGKYAQKGIFLQLEMGLITPEQFHEVLRKESIDKTITDADLDRAFGKFLLGIPVERLRQLERLHKEYKIYLLSNTNAIMWHQIILEDFKEDGHDINYYFDGVATSFELHAYKPDAAIFRRVEEIFGIMPEETLFYDDSLSNVEAARALGFKAVQVIDDKPFADYIKEID